MSWRDGQHGKAKIIAKNSYIQDNDKWKIEPKYYTIKGQKILIGVLKYHVLKHRLHKTNCF